MASKVLVGREEERSKIEGWADKLLTSGKGGSFYVSGTPGSGKTATITAVAASLQASGRCDYKHLNCMSVTPPKSLFTRLLSLIQEDAENSPPKKARGRQRAGESTDEKRLIEAICALERPLLLVLDEMDQLMEAEPEVLYSAFRLPTKPRIHLLLVGIANRLDLTERFLPKLKVEAKGSAVPQSLSFAPYTAAQLSAILAASTDGEAGSRELLSRKISAGDGDVRKALAVWGSVERKRGRGGGGGVAAVLAELRSATASPVTRARLTAQQKLMLGAALSLRRKGRTAFSLRELETEWAIVAKRLGRETAEEASETAALLESQGLLELESSTPRSSKKTPVLCRDISYRLLVDEKEAVALLQDDRLIAHLLTPAGEASSQHCLPPLPKPRARKHLF